MLNINLQTHLDQFRLDIQIELPGTGISAIYGPSGSGKTTLLRCIAGLSACQGEITLQQHTWLSCQQNINVPTHERSVGYVFQDAKLFSHLDVAGNLSFAERRAQGPVRMQRSDVLDTMDIGPLLKRRIDMLSGGEQQRVAIARTLLNQPQILLLDEPLSALDQQRKADLIPYIRRICDAFELPILFVSHGLEEVAQLADFIVLLRNGEVLATGTTQAMLEHPAMAQVAARKEQGVVIQAQVSAYDEQFQLAHMDVDDNQLVVPLTQAPMLGKQVRLYIHAGDVSIATQKPSHTSLRNILQGTIETLDTEIQGAEPTPFAEVGIRVGTQLLHARVTRASVSELQLGVGLTVFAMIKSVSLDPGN